MQRVLFKGPRGPLTLVLAALVVAPGVSRLSLTPPDAAAQGPPAVVRGRVEIGIPINTRRPTSAYPARRVPSPTLAPESERRHVVVYLRDARPQNVMPTRVAIRQINESFRPRVVAVTIGSEVEFPNDDPIYHNVFSLSRAKNFNLGRYPRGESRRVRFDRPGVVKVFCEIHSHMSATVMVFDHPWFAVPDGEGRFELPAVPAGEREVTAWHERLGDTTLRLRVESGRPAAADFVLPVPEK
jgi:plastocyanin